MGYWDFPEEYPLEPPEDEWLDYEDTADVLTFDLDVVCNIDDEGWFNIIEYSNLLKQVPVNRDENPLNPTIYSDKFSDLEVCSFDDLLEALGDVLVNEVPEVPGNYRVTGTIEWPYYFNGIWYRYDRIGDMDIDDSDARAEFEQLVVNNLKVEAE